MAGHDYNEDGHTILGDEFAMVVYEILYGVYTVAESMLCLAQTFVFQTGKQ